MNLFHYRYPGLKSWHLCCRSLGLLQNMRTVWSRKAQSASPWWPQAARSPARTIRPQSFSQSKHNQIYCMGYNSLCPSVRPPVRKSVAKWSTIKRQTLKLFFICAFDQFFPEAWIYLVDSLTLSSSQLFQGLTDLLHPKYT